jgi:tungstate transport system ATP-binding protein
MTDLLVIEGLRKRFGDRSLLDIERLAIAEKTAYVLTGANGSGKSTLLRILCGLERAQVGKLRFLGQELSLHPYPRALRDAIVYVHQHPVLFSTSVAHNIGYGLRVRGVSAAETARRVEAAMEWAGLAHLRERPPAVLSGGEKQRVALARARILAPKLLLLDEPTSNLDGPAREQVLALIPALVHAGSSVVVVCHDRDLIGQAQITHLHLADGSISGALERSVANT